MRQRFTAADRLRGLLVVLMALDHASYFVARVHPFEGWNAPPPWYATVGELVTRWPTHLCAPGFFMLMGAGMVWFACSRRHAGWSEWRIRRFFLTRGALLLILQHLLENPTWLLAGISAAGEQTRIAPSPGGGSAIILHVGVLNALGLAMLAWGWLLRAGTIVVGVVTSLALAAGTWMTPPAAEATTQFAPWLRIFFVPGQSGAINVTYPLVPWLVPVGIGVLVGRSSLASSSHSLKAWIWSGAGLLALFVTLRALDIGDFHSPPSSPAGWLSVTKYPPSAAFLAVTLGLNLVLLAAFAAVGFARSLVPLEVFGRTPLLFYLAHLWLFAALSFLLPAGLGIGAAYVTWGVAVLVLFPLSRSFDGFKARAPMQSWWRLL